MTGLDVGLQTRWDWWRSRGRRAELATRPLLRPAPRGRHRLPGIAVETTLHQATDAYHRPFGMVVVPSTGHVSVTLGCAAARRPGARVGGGVGDEWLGALEAWLSDRAEDAAYAGSLVVVRSLGSGVPARSVRALVQVTWRAEKSARSDAPALAVDAGSRLPGLVHTLNRSGLGGARPLTAGELAFVVRGAYHPAPDDAWAGGRLQWPDAVPSEHSETWQQFRHRTSSSVTWALHRLPPGGRRSAAVGALIGVPPDVVPLRVSLVHRPGSLGLLVTLTATGPQDLDAAAERLLEGLPPAIRLWLRSRYGSQAAAFATALPTGTLLDEHAVPPTTLTGA